MPIRLSELAKDRRDTTIGTPLGPLKVTYRPNALTSVDAAELAAARGDESFRVLLRQMEQLIVEWDLVGPIFQKGTDKVVVEADQPIPIKAEVLQYVPYGVLNDIFVAIQNDKNPKSTTSPSTSNDLFGGGSFA